MRHKTLRLLGIHVAYAVLLLVTLLGSTVVSGIGCHQLRRQRHSNSREAAAAQAVPPAAASLPITATTTTTSSSSRSSSSRSSTVVRLRALLAQAACSPYCAPGSCSMDQAGMMTCFRCISNLQALLDGDCGCRPGRYLVNSGGSLTCQLCPRGSWCPGGSAAAGPVTRPCSLDGSMTTARSGGAQQADCVNSPGYYYVAATSSAAPCPANTYSVGLRYQPACTSCAGGFMTDPNALPAPGSLFTSGEACKLKPGFFMRSPSVPLAVPCPNGSYNAGNNRVYGCTKCAADHVTTDGPQKTSAADCRILERGYEAKTVAGSGEITEAQPCRLNAWCPGNVAAPGWTKCPAKKWTRAAGSYSEQQCLVPPGYYQPDGGGDIQQCSTGANGTYKAGWGPARACTPCGSGIFSGGNGSADVFDPDTQTTVTTALAVNASACFVYPGMGMQRALKMVKDYYGYAGSVCRRNTGINSGSNFGRTSVTRGLVVAPCTRCAGVPYGAYNETGGYTGCALPEGYAAVSVGGSIIYTTTAFSWARVRTVTPCPKGWWCVGGDPSRNATAKPVQCPDGLTTAAAGAISAAACTSSMCEASNSEWQQASSSCICSAGYVPVGTSYALGNLTCEPCAAGTAAAANEAVCAACGGNTYSAAAAAGACVNCPGSTVANTGHTACECPAGYAPAESTSWANGNLTCSACSPGTYAAAGSPSCSNCAAGTYSSSAASNCTACSSSQYSSSAASTCSDCPANAAAISSNTACACNAGHAPAADNSWASGNLTCSACSAGTYAAAGASTCSSCAAGTYSSSTASNCTACSGNQYSGDAASTCSDCPNNTLAISSNTACACSAGFAPAADTSWASGNLSCVACTGDSYTAAAGTTCSSCPANSTVNAQHTSCSCNTGCQAAGTFPSLTCSACDYEPNAPSALAAGATNSSSISVTFNTNNAGIVGPKVATTFELRCFLATSNATCATASPDAVASVTADTAATQSISGGLPGTDALYDCFVVAFNSYTAGGVCSGSSVQVTQPAAK
uniref:Tyrosine-protein kinase ephrin type A/B receptor-like domain-containing protein n=1 Tax=Tetradesmus obliquus TaxID=3088 RepID=A0A383W677_TETOB|eukprot:jgi/Sobl393_1/19691/SZX72524.1